MIPEIPQIQNGQTVVVGLSGGVDSAVAALLLKRAGARVLAVFMKNWDDNDAAAGCHDKDDLIAAAAAADNLGVDFETVNFVDDYRRDVFEPFLRDLRRGLTPNPDVLCNSEIKFSAFVAHARARGATAVATGHYAQTDCLHGEWRLRKGEDEKKDQSYFLHRLNARQLSQAMFPLGAMHKAEVRAVARTAGLGNWARRDSTGICFIGKRRFADFISPYLPQQCGDIINAANGGVVGRHDGMAFYTIGQRQGLKLSGGPWYVAAKDAATNTLHVVTATDHPLLWRRRLMIENTRWIAAAPPPPQRVYEARLRHGQRPASCVLAEVSKNEAVIVFAEPQWAPAPGQYAVLYNGNVCLGGGVIRQAEDVSD